MTQKSELVQFDHVDYCVGLQWVAVEGQVSSDMLKGMCKEAGASHGVEVTNGDRHRYGLGGKNVDKHVSAAALLAVAQTNCMLLQSLPDGRFWLVVTENGFVVSETDIVGSYQEVTEAFQKIREHFAKDFWSSARLFSPDMAGTSGFEHFEANSFEDLTKETTPDASMRVKRLMYPFSKKQVAIAAVVLIAAYFMLPSNQHVVQQGVSQVNNLMPSGPPPKTPEQLAAEHEQAIDAQVSGDLSVGAPTIYKATYATASQFYPSVAGWGLSKITVLPAGKYKADFSYQGFGTYSELVETLGKDFNVDLDSGGAVATVVSKAAGDPEPPLKELSKALTQAAGANRRLISDFELSGYRWTVSKRNLDGGATATAGRVGAPTLAPAGPAVYGYDFEVQAPAYAVDDVIALLSAYPTLMMSELTYQAQKSGTSGDTVDLKGTLYERD